VPDIIVQKKNDVHVKVSCDRSIAYELSEYFTFFVPNYQFMPAFRNKEWDGKIRLYNVMNQELYAGLVTYLDKFAKDYGYTVGYAFDRSTIEYSLFEAKEWFDGMNFPLEDREYQLECLVHAIRNKRQLFLSATSSGKSFMMYSLIRKVANKKTLIVVPTVQLVHQMASDFAEYGLDSDKFVHKIYEGQDHNTDKPIVISTWQSIWRKRKDWFRKFGIVIGDEVHTFKANSLISMMEKIEHCPYRIGFTGTLDDTETHRLVLEGLFGPVKKIISAKEMIEQGYSSEFEIKIICLEHKDEVRKACSQAKTVMVEGHKKRVYPKYQEEIDVLIGVPSRNRYIRNLALSLNGNSLVLFQYVEKHGKVLYDMIKDKAGDRKVFFVHGGVAGDERERIRQIVETETNAIIVASYGVFSTGVNIKNLSNLIFASPSKAKIKILQSIGRILRKTDNPDVPDRATLFDIADDVSWKSRQCYAIQHMKERVKIYKNEGFTFKMYNVKLG